MELKNCASGESKGQRLYGESGRRAGEIKGEKDPLVEAGCLLAGWGSGGTG